MDRQERKDEAKHLRGTREWKEYRAQLLAWISEATRHLIDTPATDTAKIAALQSKIVTLRGCIAFVDGNKPLDYALTVMERQGE